MEEMDVKEVLEWMAYEMSIDPDTRERYMKEIAVEKARNQTLAEEAARVKAFLVSLGGN